jgi:hypothetical protein
MTYPFEIVYLPTYLLSFFYHLPIVSCNIRSRLYIDLWFVLFYMTSVSVHRLLYKHRHVCINVVRLLQKSSSSILFVYESLNASSTPSQGSDVPFCAAQLDVITHGGQMPAGSSPSSVSNKATTPWAGTALAVKLRTAVPLLVWVQRSRTEY